MDSKQLKKTFFDDLNKKRSSRYWQDLEAENSINFGDFYFEDFRGKRIQFFNDENPRALEFE